MYKRQDELIDNIFRDRLNDGQLDNAALTLADLAKIKRSFAATLHSMMHTRIEYPKIEEGAEKARQKKTGRLKKKVEIAVDSKESEERPPAEKVASGS